MRGSWSGGTGTVHFRFPTQGQLPRTAYGPEELTGIFLSRGMCEQMTRQGGVACGFLRDQQLQGVTPGTAICSHPPLDWPHPGSPTQTEFRKYKEKAEVLRAGVRGHLTGSLLSVQTSHPLRLDGSGLVMQCLHGINSLGFIP